MIRPGHREGRAMGAPVEMIVAAVIAQKRGVEHRWRLERLLGAFAARALAGCRFSRHRDGNFTGSGVKAFVCAIPVVPQLIHLGILPPAAQTAAGHPGALHPGAFEIKILKCCARHADVRAMAVQAVDPLKPLIGKRMQHVQNKCKQRACPHRDGSRKTKVELRDRMVKRRCDEHAGALTQSARNGLRAQ